MNVIVANRNQALLSNLGVDVIKEMTGEFDVDEIIATFQNFFYQRMILDITAIKDYKNIANLQKLSISLDMDKVILLLDGTDDTSNPAFLSNLVSMGIYNFTKNVEGIQYLYNTPNTYRDVAQFHQLANNNVMPTQPQPQIIYQKESVPVYVEKPSNDTRVIGIKNLTKQSGATTLTYMMKNELSKHYKVVAIEVDKSDFIYFKDRSLISTNTSSIGQVINKNKNSDVILLDLNNSSVAEGYCSEILYLIEPSIIKLQKLVLLNYNALRKVGDSKIILNQSLLSKNDVANFEYDSKLKVFYNLIPLNERNKNLPELDGLLNKLGFTRLK